MKKVVAIVGRPNVGKSTLFNRMIGKRVAIVHHTSGVTRDRNYGEVEWTGKKFFLIDTGGFVPDTEVQFNKHIRAQIMLALEECDKVLFVVDAVTGLHPVDYEIINILRKYSKNKEVITVVNKCDDSKRDMHGSEFYKLGIGEPFMVSALSGRNVAEVLDFVLREEEGISSDEKEHTENRKPKAESRKLKTESRRQKAENRASDSGTGLKNYIQDENDQEEIDYGFQDMRPKFAVIGRPNAGKSSIVNALLQEKRHIVTEIPGTPRDSIDSIVKYHGEDILFIDTAGLVKKNKLRKAESIEFFSTVRTYRAIQRCDVAILVIDATLIMESLNEAANMDDAIFKLDKQDVRILEDVFEYRKGLLIVVNKWDLVEKDHKTTRLIEKKIVEHLRSYDFLSMIFISALTKQRIHRVLEDAMVIYNERKKAVKTSDLNEVILNEIKMMPPPAVRGKEIKINYITQVSTAPPVIAFFTNEPRIIPENYKKYLQKKVRQHFGFQGVPLTLVFKKKN